MATNLGTAYIRIAPRLDGVSSSITSALTGGASGATGGISSVLSGAVGQIAIGTALGSALVAGVKAVASTIINTVKDIIGAATEQMDSVIRTKVALSQMGYSEKVVAKNLEKLRKNANKTAADFGDLADGFLALTASWKDINLTADATQALSNAILAMGGTPEMVANAITQIGQVDLDGPLDGETWRSLRNSGLIPVLGTIAEMNGMTLAQYKEELGGNGSLPTRNFIEALIELDKQGNETQKSLEEIAISNAAATWSGSWEAAKENIVSSVSKVMEKIWSASGLGQKIIDIADTIGENIPKVVEEIKNRITAFLAETGLDKFLPKLMEFIGGTIKLLYNLSMMALTPVYTILSALYNNVLKPLINIISTILTPVLEVLGGVFEWLSNVISDFTNSTLAEFVGGFIEGVKIGCQILGQVLKGLWDAIVAIFQGVGKWFSDTFGGAIQAIKDAFSPIVQWFKDRWNDIKNVFKGVRDLGKNIVEGLWNGINDMVGWIKEKISQFSESVLNGIKEFFGIHSPSKLMAEQGKYIAQGLGKGIADNAKYAVNAIDDLSQQLFNEAVGLNADVGMLQPQLSAGSFVQAGAYQAQPQVVQNNTFNQVADDLDVKEASKLLGFEVATAI